MIELAGNMNKFALQGEGEILARSNCGVGTTPTETKNLLCMVHRMTKTEQFLPPPQPPGNRFATYLPASAKTTESGLTRITSVIFVVTEFAASNKVFALK